MPSPGDIIITREAPFGEVAIIPAGVRGCLGQRMVLLRPNAAKVDAHYMTYALLSHDVQREMVAQVGAGSTVGNLRIPVLKALRIRCPELPEQRRIASALCDADALIAGLEKLIAKKRDVKQAAMQELLTGRTRLTGFGGKWETKRLGDISHIKTGSRNNQDKVDDGEYPFFVRSATVERINSYSFEGEAILVPGEGGIGSILHYIDGRFDVHQRVYKISRFTEDVYGKFVYYSMIVHFGPHATQNSVKAAVDSLRLPTFKSFAFQAPEDVEEQKAIATVLSDMEAEIAALEMRLSKTRDLRQGMMQELLTGRTRLI